MTTSKRVELQEYCEIVAGGRQGLTGKDFVEAGFPAFGAGGVNGHLESFEFDRPAVVLSSIGARCGKCFLAEGQWSSLANTQLIFPDPREVDVRFLWYQLNDERSWHRSGTAQPFIKPSDVKKRRVYLPSIEEQRRVVALLDQADELRAKRQTSLALLDSLNESIFLDMFGDPVSNQRGWDLVALGELGDLDRGVSRHRPRNDPQLLGGAYPLIQTGDVTRSGGYITRFTTTYSDLGLNQSRLWPAGTLCITIAANIARTGILGFDACFPDSVVGFTPSERSTVEYVREVLNFHQKRLEDTAPEFAQKNINLRILRELQVPCPPKDLQTRFSELAGHARRLGGGVGESISAHDELFASLQQRAFTGQL